MWTYNQGETELYIASKYGRTDAMRALLREKEGKVDVNRAANGGWTPLHIAAHEEKVEALQILISNGAIVDQADRHGETALHVAARKGNAEVIKVLLNGKSNVNHPSRTGWTPLHVAAFNGCANATHALLAGGASINQADFDAETAVYIAAQMGKVNVITILIDAGADVNKRNKRGWTPLDIAIRRNQIETINILFKAGGVAYQSMQCTPVTREMLSADYFAVLSFIPSSTIFSLRRHSIDPFLDFLYYYQTSLPDELRLIICAFAANASRVPSDSEIIVARSKFFISPMSSIPSSILTNNMDIEGTKKPLLFSKLKNKTLEPQTTQTYSRFKLFNRKSNKGG